MIDRIVTIGGTLGFVLLLLLGRDLIGFFQPPSELGGTAEIRSKDEHSIERAKQVSQALTARLRQDLVAIAREEMKIERLAKTTSHGNLIARKKHLAAAQRQVDALLVSKDQLLAALGDLNGLESNEHPPETLNSSMHIPLQSDRTASLRSLVNEIETQLTSTELHFMEEVLPVVHHAPPRLQITDLAKVNENSSPLHSVSEEVGVSSSSKGALPESPFFESAARKNDIVGNAY